MLVHHCNRCCVYKKEIQPCRTKYWGIWGILMHKMMFPSESCNSVSKGIFREFRPFSVIAERSSILYTHSAISITLTVLGDVMPPPECCYWLCVLTLPCDWLCV